MSIEIEYRFPPSINPEKQGKIIAIGQTAGTWSDRFEHRSDVLQSHLAEVINIRQDQQGWSIVTIRFPLHNVEGDIASLLTMIFGKYSMAGAGKIIKVSLPENYGTKAKFGLTGIRKQLGVYNRPLVMAIFKPALGLTAQDHADILSEVAYAGIDIIKDDEIMGDLATAPTLERLKACRQVLQAVKEKTGKTVLYAVNVTGRADQLLEKARLLVQEGANALLFNVLCYGYSVLEALSRDPLVNVPIFAHPALAGAFSAGVETGIAYPVILGTLMAQGGADAVLYPAHYGSLPFSAEDEWEIRDILRQNNVFPVPSAGIKAELVPQIYHDYGQDVILNSGTGIMDHPISPAEGVKAFFTALTKL